MNNFDQMFEEMIEQMIEKMVDDMAMDLLKDDPIEEEQIVEEVENEVQEEIMNCEIEVWRDIEGYENLYQVSNFGRVKSLRRNQIIQLRKPQNRDTLGLYLYKNGEKKWHTIQFLVLKTFVGTFNDKYYTMLHLDGDCNNNRLDNLMWADELNDIPVYCITTKKVYKSAIVAKEIDGYNPKAILRSCKLKNQHAGRLDDGTKCRWAFLAKKLYDKCAKGRNILDVEKLRASLKNNR